MKRAVLWTAWVTLICLPAYALAQPALEKPANAASGISRETKSPLLKPFPEKHGPAPPTSGGPPAPDRPESPQPGSVTRLNDEWDKSKSAKRWKIQVPAPGGGNLGDVKFGATPNRAKTMFSIPW